MGEADGRKRGRRGRARAESPPALRGPRAGASLAQRGAAGAVAAHTTSKIAHNSVGRAVTKKHEHHK